ncbi:IgGFc-binding protein [Chryseobacterium antibioticum]|uniref:IgGFc-binding protein n=1 Tax=Chryseobacterium pyrolae TaxID=2987481 RepID=A0ABT2IC99_9FLAO|nr:IgGFc-binding protein [Chryseobacterium pyrolae]MCT2406260.1 IgGFc-binding protein [Chryseobacterium pyrolae]
MKLIINILKKHNLRVVWSIYAVLLTCSQCYKAQTLLTDSFNYAPGTLLTGSNWNALAGTGTNNITVSNGNLAYSGSIGNGMGNKVSLANNGQDVYRTFTSTSAPIYSSLVVNVSAANVAGDFFYSIGTSGAPATTVGAKLFVKSNGSGFSFGVLRGTGGVPVYETTVRPFNTNVMVVLKYDVVAGATNDDVKLYVNPGLSAEPVTADAEYTAAVGTDVGAFSAIALLQGTAVTAPTLQVDGINVGTTWASVTSPVYDYGDVPTTYDFTKDGVYAPAGHSLLAGFALGSTIPDLELSPLSVTVGANNNGTNGDGTDEDAVNTASNQMRKGIVYSLSVPVINNAVSTKYLYGWIDFNNDGRFQVGEAAPVVAFSAAGNSTQTLTWIAAQTATIATGPSNLYVRLRISDQLLADFTTAASGGALIDERSIGNGAVSTANAADAPTVPDGEVEDYQIAVVDTYEYGDLPVSYEQPGGTFLPARQLLSSSLKIGATTDIESVAQNVSPGANNNGTNGDGLDEDGIDPATVSITPSTLFTLPVNVTNISGAASTLYGWLDINKNGVLETGEVATAAVGTGTNGTPVNLSWTAAQTANISGTEVYLRLRLTGTALADNAATAAYDERAFADGLNTGIYGTTPGIGEIEDYRISVNPGYDFGDVPVSYDQPTGILIPARQIPSATLRIGNTTPDIEYNVQSVATDTDNNGTNGDGLDEEGINPSVHPVTPTAIFTLPVSITNTSGAARTLYGWLDVNNNGIFEVTEVATVLVPNNAVSVNLIWTAATTGQLASSQVYLRLRLTNAGLSDNGATTGYDERAFADGINPGVYGTAPGIGEIEDYRLAVNAVFDFGDAPESFEINNSIDVVPARHIPASTLYLGSIYDTESSNNAVTAGANNSGINGDGADENGISGTLPQLNSTTTSYSVNVNVYKTIAGTATLHGWIDMDGDGRFSESEYTSVAVTGTTGVQTAVLTWSAPFYFDTGAATSYMRLRFTTAVLTDNAATALVDERSIGDGLSTGVYGTTYANGEIEDYPVPLTTPVIIDPNLDSDGDGVRDTLDLDDDNDGILDSAEGPVSLNDSAFKLYNTPNFQGTTAYQWNLYITGTAGTTVTYTPYGGAATPAVIPASGILVISLLPTQVPNWPLNNVTSGKYVQVSSSSPVSILQEIQGAPAADDATVVYPPSVWGTKYTVNSYPNASFTNGIQIFSASDNNLVVVKNKAGATVASFTLNNGQNYVYDNGAPDSTGFTVTSTKSVGVMSYTRCATATSGACDNLVEYLLPDRLLGTKFLTRSASNTGRMIITATQSGTAVKVDGTVVTVLSNPGDTYAYTQNTNTSQIIETSAPVQFTKIVPYNYDPSVTTIQDVTKATLGPAIMSIPTTMTTSNRLTIFVKTGNTGKMLYNGSPISGWAPFSYDSTYSYVTLTNANGITAGSLVSISSTTGDVPFMTDWYGIGNEVTAATPLSIGGVSVVSGTNSANSYKDTDGDGIPDYLDLDSDNDGCLDALEGDENVAANQLVNAGGTLTVGTGSTASNKNLCASSICVDAQGVPTVVNSGGAADVNGNQGQGIGNSENSLLQDAACLLTPFCYKPGIISGTSLDSKAGITSLNRAGATDPDNWPMIRKGAWMVLESKTKGFVVNRLPFNGTGNPVGIPVADFVEGMMVYDTTNNCLKMYTSTDGGSTFSWQCLNTQTCPD